MLFSHVMSNTSRVISEKYHMFLYVNSPGDFFFFLKTSIVETFRELLMFKLISLMMQIDYDDHDANNISSFSRIKNPRIYK